MTWADLTILEDEDMIFAFHDKYLTIGCPGHEWKKGCDLDPIECAARGRCHKIHTERHTDALS